MCGKSSSMSPLVLDYTTLAPARLARMRVPSY